jgi:hypothetical protein
MMIYYTDGSLPWEIKDSNNLSDIYMAVSRLKKRLAPD